MSPEKKQQGSSLTTGDRLAVDGWAAFPTSATETNVGGSDTGVMEEGQLTCLNTGPEKHLDLNIVVP